MKLSNWILLGTVLVAIAGCSSVKKEYRSYDSYPVRSGDLLEMEYTPQATTFYLWSPTADEVRVMLYDAGDKGHEISS